MSKFNKIITEVTSEFDLTDNQEKFIDTLFSKEGLMSGTDLHELLKVNKFSRMQSTYYARKYARENYSWAVPSVEVVKEIIKYSPLVEVGAGTGYWSKLLREFGANIIATDSKAQFDDYGFKKYPFKNVLIIWPTYDEEWAYKAIQFIKSSSYLLYIGEGLGGCNATDNFFNELDKNFKEIKLMRMPRWDGIYDYFSIHQKK